MNTLTHFITKNRTYTNPTIIKPTGIIVHSTGCNQVKPSAYYTRWDNQQSAVSVHGFIGVEDGELLYVQTLPYNFKSWNCGKGAKGSYNNSHISFEICEDDLASEDYFRKTKDMAAELCATLCNKYGIPVQNITTHCEAHKAGYASNHADILHWWSKYHYTMDDFRKEVQDKMTETEKNTPSAYAREAWEKAKSKQYTDGTNPRNPLTREQLFVILDRMGIL